MYHANQTPLLQLALWSPYVIPKVRLLRSIFHIEREWDGREAKRASEKIILPSIEIPTSR